MRVLLVEDEPYMADAIRNGLRLEAIAADIAGDGDAALELLSVNAYDIAVLDRNIPGPTGDEIAERIVASGSGMPILMLTAADRLDDKATGFELGADDYLTKPFKFDELLARVRALIRRGGAGRTEILKYGALELDRLKHKVRVDTRHVDLTPKEFHLLQHFLLHPEEVVRRTELLEKVWDMHFDPESNVVDVHVGNLRRKLKTAAGKELIQTVRGVGFRLQDPDQDEK